MRNVHMACYIHTVTS